MTLDHDTERLTPREQEVLDLASRGLTNDEIAEELDLSHNAVRFHLKRVHAKLDTGGDRSVLARFRGWLSGAAFFGLAKGGVAPVVAIGAVSLGLAGAAVAFYPGGSSARSGDVTPGADGRYPNGCPSVMSPQIGIETLADFARAYGATLDEIRALNPGLPESGPLPTGAEVHLPYVPNSGCGEAQATPAGTTPSAGGTPAGSDVEGAGTHFEAQLTPAGTTSDLDFAFEVVSSGDTVSASAESSRGICFRIYGSDAVADLRPFKLLLDGVDRRSELTWFVAPDHEHAEACLAQDAIAEGRHEAVILFDDLVSGAERELTRWSFEVVP